MVLQLCKISLINYPWDKQNFLIFLNLVNFFIRPLDNYTIQTWVEAVLKFQHSILERDEFHFISQISISSNVRTEVWGDDFEQINRANIFLPNKKQSQHGRNCPLFISISLNLFHNFNSRTQQKCSAQIITVQQWSSEQPHCSRSSIPPTPRSWALSR